MGLFDRNRHEANFAIIGLGRFGRAVAETLAANGQDLILVDKDPDIVRDLRHLTDNAYVVENVDQKALEEIGVADCSVAVIGIGTAMDASILATLYCLNLKVPRVIAKAISNDQGLVLEKLGAEVVYPEKEMGDRLGNQLSNEQVLDYCSIAGSIDIAQLHVPESFIGQKLIDLQLRHKYGVSIIAIISGDETIDNIKPDYVFKKGDTIVLVGSGSRLENFESGVGLQ